MRPPLAPPRLSEPRKVEAEAHAVETNSATDKPEAKTLALRSGNVPGIDQWVIDGWERVLPDQVFGRTSGPR